ncbi:type I-F CRISPR-associated endoribonuclease Cas6/Csy4 [candidate division CSSED10-310 bacterium]|uniref:Type I-F CRISPR-associated endoribonuclease Cas6/Csy4 n=1 Tax=candidate division CSSED10-310 bacterium TaxID=2855610 RepID=A0ABV6YZU0_UNCC1
MKYYQDITLLPAAEVNSGFLWQKVYQQVHLALVEMKTPDNRSKIAVSFPEYGEKKFPLGNKLRLFAETQELLKKLDMANWLKRLADYSHCTAIREVPRSVSQFAYFKRKQVDTNIQRLSRRRAKRKGVSLEQALKDYSGFKDKETNLPFVNIVSLSKEKKRFRLFILREIVKKHSPGEFSCYGLSSRESDKQATVPWF